MNQTARYYSPQKESRRILSEKSANACLSPARSPVKRALIDSSPKKLLPSPSFIAQKRSITQVDSDDFGARDKLRVQRVEARVSAASPLVSTAERNISSESITEPDAMNLDVEEQTEQQQQNHRQTNSHMDHEHSQAELVSNRPESMTTTSQTIPSDPETRKQFIQEKASLLRNRLQNAMRHVCDPQFDRRVSELEAHSRKYPRLSGTGAGSNATQQQEREEHLKRKYDSEEEGQAENGNLVLSTPRPQINANANGEAQHEEDEDEDEDEEMTPTQETHAQSQRAVASPTQMLLSSPIYNSNPSAGRFDDDRPRGAEASAGTVTVETSPSQRGESDGDAVDGLLKLMATGTEPKTGE
ncbi:hypothetical protein BJX99DRAFT_263849 [Aspergillus californicus]